MKKGSRSKRSEPKNFVEHPSELLSIQEEQKILEVVEKQGTQEERLALRLMLEVGLTPEQVSNLRIEDIDFKTGTIRLRPQRSPKK